MSSFAEEQLKVGFEILDHNIAAGYVTYIVDVWEGPKNDPATSVVRYIGVWAGDVLEDEEGNAFDPDFGKIAGSHSWDMPDPKPLLWKNLEVIKTADREALNYKDQSAKLLDPERRTYGSDQRKKDLYIAFINAIDVLAVEPENEEAWTAVQAYRDYNAKLHEK